jgi:hypothetical protein
VRGLAPDRCRIELSELGPERDETRMMRAMGWETANIHLGTRSAVKDVLDDLKGRKANWLRRSVEKMMAVTLRNWEMWKGDPHLRSPALDLLGKSYGASVVTSPPSSMIS